MTETKLDHTDVISVDDYIFESKPRQAKYIRKSGGIGVFIKQSLQHAFEIVETDSDYIFWLKLSKQYSKLDQDIMFGVAYVPPTQSRVLNEDELANFEIEITSVCSSYDFVYICGDINARTAEMCDYTSVDEFLARHFDFDDETMLFYNQKSTLETMGIQLHRTSMDKHTNNNGYRLVEICKNNNLTILNGRFGRDKGIGRMTFRNTSVIDYAISSVKGLTLLTDFEVIETDILHSDGHSLITLNVDIPFCSNQTNLKSNKPRRRATWKQAESRTFVENINQVGIEEVTRFRVYESFLDFTGQPVWWTGKICLTSHNFTRPTPY